jgi:hypothetical protein
VVGLTEKGCIAMDGGETTFPAYIFSISLPPSTVHNHQIHTHEWSQENASTGSNVLGTIDASVTPATLLKNLSLLLALHRH